MIRYEERNICDQDKRLIVIRAWQRGNIIKVSDTSTTDIDGQDDEGRETETDQETVQNLTGDRRNSRIDEVRNDKVKGYLNG